MPLAPLALLTHALRPMDPTEPLHVPEPFATIPADFFGTNWPLALTMMICGAVLIVTTHRRFAKRRHKKRILILGQGRGPGFMLTDILCHAIRKGPMVHPARLRRAVQVANDLTGMDYDEETLRQAARYADKIVMPLSFAWMRPALDHAGRRRIVEAATAVMLESGPLTNGDRAFLRTVATSIGTPPERVQAMHWLHQPI
ncbi:hypothetical protein [Jannaschia aquimarina]|uniref:Tellurite resistance protein TerB n=1 Tax=Jannaschia aquimarina TaxID=935700 RepID=A0A0D1D265_9RHOB|nr:hypothetical protein [Jannaschia aquimarina]KIT14218.1 hypothetical protein jaqu_40120 [Jannaschia aquimarina]SNS48432.1 hypothetical protein SAMN05421775_101132 [Jannaschia aquimarina]